VEWIGYGPRLLALSSLRRCMVRTILLGGFYLCVNLSASILELKLCQWSEPVHERNRTVEDIEEHTAGSGSK
jgi:hypothetical protein